MEDKNPEFLLPSKSPDELLQIVKEFLAGKILFSNQVEDSMLGSVFMPLGLGGLCYPVDEPVQKAPVPLPPIAPVRRPKVTPVKDSSKLDTTLATAVQALEEAQYKHRWEPDPVSEATLAELAAAETAVRTAKKAKQNFQKSAQLRADKENSTNEKAYQAALVAYEDAVTKHKSDWAVWEAAETTLVAEWKARSEVWDKSVADLLGVVYGYLETAAPRSVNGYPMFFTMHLLNKADWAKVKTTIKREQERTIEIA